MSGKDKAGNDWMTGLGMVIAFAMVLLAGAAVVVALSTPISMVLAVIAFAMVILFAGKAVTRESASTDRTGKEDAMCESVDLFSALESKNVVVVQALTGAPRVPVSATVTNVTGPCPLGLMPGNTWIIGPDGTLSRPMCLPGAAALSVLFGMASGEVMGRPVCCGCVAAGWEVTITVREAV